MGLDNNREIHQEKTETTETSDHSDYSAPGLQHIQHIQSPNIHPNELPPTPLHKGHIAICSKSLYYEHVEAQQ
jgi:hypothetical protein